MFLSFSASVLAFDSYEHIATGTNGVRLKFPGDQQVFEDFPYKTYYQLLLDPNNQAKVGKIDYYPQYLLVRYGDQVLKLSYGEYIAIAGDFAGRKDGTISSGIELKDFEKMRPELESSFSKAFEAVLPSPGNPLYQNGNLEYLRGLFKNEYQSLILKLARKGGVHFNNASSHSIASTVKDQWAYAKSPGYVDLLSINVDHFEDDAKISYSIGHTLALEKAKKAFQLKEKGELEEAIATLNMAYVMDAFASHFLTDLFSAGHLRTPRGPLLEITKSTKNRALGYVASNVGLMANAMHDEDNYAGLWLKDANGDVWNAFGDGSFFDVKSLDNRQAIREALQASVDEIYKAFDTGSLTKYKDFSAMKQVGVPLPSGNDLNKELVNPYPLFRMGKNDWPEVRKNYYDNAVGDYQAITQATGGTSFYKSDLGTFNHGNFNSFLLEAHLVEPLKKDVMVECYNKFDRESIWPVKADEYETLSEPVNMVYVDNSSLQFYKRILLGNLRPDGIYYVVNEEAGEKIIKECKHAMETMKILGKKLSSEVVEIRGRIDRASFSHPVVVFDKDGNLRRLQGYKSN